MRRVPIRGSEPGQSWNWAWHLARDHEVWLVNAPEFRDEVEAFLAVNPNENLQIVWVTPPEWLDPWRPHLSSTGWRFKVHYLLWLACVQRAVAKLIRMAAIDIVHQVGLLTVSAPSRLWALQTPFVWGPIGGGETAPPAFRVYYGESWRRECIRRWRIRLVAASPRLRRTVRHAAHLTAVNRETEALLMRAGADPTRVALSMDTALRPGWLRPAPRRFSGTGALTLLWVGRLEARKALPILLDALALLDARTNEEAPGVRLLVAGSGPRRGEWEDYARRKGLAERVSFLGPVPPERMLDLYDRADIFAFTSLQDAFGSVVVEALARALPTIVPDHQGCGALLPDGCVLKIPVRAAAEMVSLLADALDELRRRPDRLAALSSEGLAFARRLDWPTRVAGMVRIYERILAKPDAEPGTTGTRRPGTRPCESLHERSQRCSREPPPRHAPRPSLRPGDH